MVTLAKRIEAKPHSPVYVMHKYFARRPWNVFNELVSVHSRPGDIVLDPFCGGGVTIVESLRLKRKAVGVDLNPLSTYITKMECAPSDLSEIKGAFAELERRVMPKISSFYRTTCGKCGSPAIADWIEWDEKKHEIVRIKYDCPACGGSNKKLPSKLDYRLVDEVNREFRDVSRRRLHWFPRTPIPAGDKTNSLLNKHLRFFHELFTNRNLLSLAILLEEINGASPTEVQEFLRFTFSSSLKWASRQSHMRAEIVEGWAMHAYWIYPKTLEINVWNTFQRRTAALIRGKEYSNHEIGNFCRFGRSFDDLLNGDRTCLLLNTSSARLPIPNEAVDVIITDPPYGGNVNYTELSDFWYVWLSEGKIIDKEDEAIINRTRGKDIIDYERMLYAIFEECYRVLKNGHHLISTFNSKDFRIVSSFIIAAMRAGFTLSQDDVSYQNPIHAYTTTFHAMQIGAFAGDFIFKFEKSPTRETKEISMRQSELEAKLRELVSGAISNRETEQRLRERAYALLIPFLAEHAKVDAEVCRHASDFFESTIREHEHHFKGLRIQLTQARRNKFAHK